MAGLFDDTTSPSVTDVKSDTGDTSPPGSITTQLFSKTQSDVTTNSPQSTKMNITTILSQSTLTGVIPSQSQSSSHFGATTSATQSATEAAAAGGGDDGAWKVAVGVSVPLILIVIVVLVVAYILYRRKYPVRMIIGREFSKYRNPDYSRPRSTATLVRDDADAYFSASSKSIVLNMNEMQQTNSSIQLGRENLGYQRGDDEEDGNEVKDVGDEYEDIQDREFLSKKGWLFKNHSDDEDDSVQIVNEVPGNNPMTRKVKHRAGTGTSSVGSGLDSDMSDVEAMLSEQKTTPIPKRKRGQQSTSSNGEVDHSDTSVDEEEKGGVDEYEGETGQGSKDNEKLLKEHPSTYSREFRSQSLTNPPVEVVSKPRSLSFDLLKSARRGHPTDEPDIGKQSISASLVKARVVSMGSNASSLSSIPSTHRRNTTASVSSVNSNPHLVTDLDDSDKGDDAIDEVTSHDKASLIGNAQSGARSDGSQSSPKATHGHDGDSNSIRNGASEISGQANGMAGQSDFKTRDFSYEMDEDEKIFLTLGDPSSHVDEIVYENVIVYAEKHGRSKSLEGSNTDAENVTMDHGRTSESQTQREHNGSRNEFSIDQDLVYEDTNAECDPLYLKSPDDTSRTTQSKMTEVPVEHFSQQDSLVYEDTCDQPVFASQGTALTEMQNNPSVELDEPTSDFYEDTSILSNAVIQQEKVSLKIKNQSIGVRNEHSSDAEDLNYEDTSLELESQSVNPQSPSIKNQTDIGIALHAYDVDENDDLYEDLCDSLPSEESKYGQFIMSQGSGSGTAQNGAHRSIGEGPSELADNIYDNAPHATNRPSFNGDMKSVSRVFDGAKENETNKAVLSLSGPKTIEARSKKETVQVDDSRDPADDSDGNSSSMSKTSSDEGHCEKYSFNENVEDDSDHSDDEEHKWVNVYPAERPPFMSDPLSSIEEETSPNASYRPEPFFQVEAADVVDAMSFDLGHGTHMSISGSPVKAQRQLIGARPDESKDGHEHVGMQNKDPAPDLRKSFNQKQESDFEFVDASFQESSAKDHVPRTSVGTNDFKKSVRFDSTTADSDTVSNVSSPAESLDVDDISLSDIEEPSDFGGRFKPSSSSTSPGSGLKMVSALRFSDGSSDSSDDMSFAGRPILKLSATPDANTKTLQTEYNSKPQGDNSEREYFTLEDIDDALSSDDETKISMADPTRTNQIQNSPDQDDLAFSFDVARQYRVRPDESDGDIDV